MRGGANREESEDPSTKSKEGEMVQGSAEEKGSETPNTEREGGWLE